MEKCDNTYSKLLFSLENKGNSDIFINTDESDAKENKPDLERQIPYDSSYISNLKQSNL